jgi:hypothetical protein
MLYIESSDVKNLHKGRDIMDALKALRIFLLVLVLSLSVVLFSQNACSGFLKKYYTENKSVSLSYKPTFNGIRFGNQTGSYLNRRYSFGFYVPSNKSWYLEIWLRLDSSDSPDSLDRINPIIYNVAENNDNIKSGFYFYIDSTNHVVMKLYHHIMMTDEIIMQDSSELVSNTSLVQGQWYHILYEQFSPQNHWGDQDCSFYINGVFDTSGYQYYSNLRTKRNMNTFSYIGRAMDDSVFFCGAISSMQLGTGRADMAKVAKNIQDFYIHNDAENRLLWLTFDKVADMYISSDKYNF